MDKHEIIKKVNDLIESQINVSDDGRVYNGGFKDGVHFVFDNLQLPPHYTSLSDDNEISTIINSCAGAFNFWFKIEDNFGDGPAIEDLLQAMIDHIKSNVKV